MTNSELHSRLYRHLMAAYPHRFTSVFLASTFADTMIACHGEEQIEWLLTKCGSKAGWANNIRTADEWQAVESAKAIEAHKQKSASWQVAK